MEHKALFHRPTGRYIEEYYEPGVNVSFCLVEKETTPELKPNSNYYNFNHLFLGADMETEIQLEVFDVDSDIIIQIKKDDCEEHIFKTEFLTKKQL